MSEQEHIFLRSGLSPEATAERLAEVLQAHVRRHDGEVGLYRAAGAEPSRSIGGEVIENEYGEDDPGPGEESVFDDYDLVLELWLSGDTDEELLHAESRRLFDEIVALLPWPAVHAKVGASLYSAWSPSLGRTDFPPDTSPYAETRSLWEPYAHP